MLGITPVASAEDSAPDPDATTTTVAGTDPATTTTVAPETATTTAPAETSTTTAPETTTTAAETTTAAPTTTAEATTTTTEAATTTTTPAPGVGAVPLASNSVATLTKTAVVPGGGTVKPGMEFLYSFYVACTNIDTDCVNFTFTDAIPAGLVIVQTPQSNSIRTVTTSGNTITMAYQMPLTNPVGSTGWTSGSNEAFDVVVRLPADTAIPDGTEITNTANVTVKDQTPLTDSAKVTVEIPKVLTPLPSKQWPGGAVHAGSGATTQVTIGAANGSPAALTVTSLNVTDNTTATWRNFDLAEPVTLASMPPGATLAQLQLCTAANNCADGTGWANASTATTAGQAFTLGGTDAADVTGVRVVFTGTSLTGPTSDAGTVTFGLKLRSTLRGTASDPVVAATVQNCVTSTAATATDSQTSGTACASKDIWPSNVTLTANKVWVPDTNGNFSQDTGEYAVAGAESGVSARVTAKNTSPFPINQIVITEPSTTGTTDFDKFDVQKIRLTYPNGATTARVQVTYAGSPATDDTYTPADPTTITIAGGTKVTSVTVTYTGGSTSEPAIAADATAGLDLHGNLTSAVTAAGTLSNCADVTVTPGTGANPPTGPTRPCGNLPVAAQNPHGTGTKTSSQSSIPDDQPFTYTLTFTNDGNLALTNPIVTDPAAGADPFASLQLLSATASTNQPTSPPLALQLQAECGGIWTNFTVAGAIPASCDPTGVRVNGTGTLEPTRNIQMTLRVQRRATTTDGTEINNCFGATASGLGIGEDGLTVTGTTCIEVTADPPAGGATIEKTIAPAQLPAWTPGLPKQNATVTLRIANTGNLSADTLQITDDDADFFGDVDFVSFGARQNPNGANQLKIEALLGGSWVQVYQGNAGTPTPTFPNPYTAADVRGLQFSFTNTAGGYAMPPCIGNADSCAGYVRFVVTPHQAADVGPTLEDTAKGAYRTIVDGGSLKPTNTDDAELELVPGTPKINVDKTPENSILGPGSTVEQVLTMTNEGTNWLQNPSIVDVLPPAPGLAFDETFNDGINPFTVEVSGLPDGYPAAPAPSYEPARTGERIDSVRWTFGDTATPWKLPPGATIKITIRVGLEPGVTTGQQLVNKMRATGTSGNPNGQFTCTNVAGTETGEDGTYCTDTANTGVVAGAAFQARKWVAGKAELGWWNSTTSSFVPTGDPSCPSMTVGTKKYTATPCVALVERGGTFDYVLRIVNAGTESATRMALVDNLPVQGDAGLIGGAARGTEWNNRPTLAGPATYSGTGTSTLGYSSAAAGGWCTDDLYLDGPACDAADWSGTAGASTTALRLLVDFGQTPLPPGQGIELTFQMNVPASLDQESDVTIAWNSFAHAEQTLRAGNAGTRTLPPIEPVKVGVSPFLPGKVRVGDYVWVDTNRDGRQDDGEPGIKDVTLTITGPDGGPVFDIYGNEVLPTKTDADGKYIFDNLPILEEGQSYTVHIDETSPALAPYVPTTPGQGDRIGDSSTGSASSEGLTEDGQEDLTLDFGFVLPKVSVGDFVWVDTNRDGRQDAGEPGIKDVTLTIKGPDGNDVTDVFGNVVGPTKTDANGKYLFENLPVLEEGQSYTVYIDQTSPALKPYIPTIANVGDRVGDSSTGSAKSEGLTEDGDHDPTLDFGFIQPKVSVGDFVWVDTNRDGRQDPGEPGIPGVRLTITGPDGGPVTDVFGNPVGPTTTDGSGKYLFENLPALPAGQSYTVHIDPSSPALEPYVPTTPGVGDRAGDSSTGSATSTDLTVDGAHDPTLDFGFVTPSVQPPPPSEPSTTVPNPGTLPSTGLRTTTLVLVAGVLLLAGGLLVITRRRYARNRS